MADPHTPRKHPLQSIKAALAPFKHLFRISNSKPSPPTPLRHSPRSPLQDPHPDPPPRIWQLRVYSLLDPESSTAAMTTPQGPRNIDFPEHFMPRERQTITPNPHCAGAVDRHDHETNNNFNRLGLDSSHFPQPLTDHLGRGDAAARVRQRTRLLLEAQMRDLWLGVWDHEQKPHVHEREVEKRRLHDHEYEVGDDDSTLFSVSGTLRDCSTSFDSFPSSSSFSPPASSSSTTVIANDTPSDLLQQRHSGRYQRFLHPLHPLHCR